MPAAPGPEGSARRGPWLVLSSLAALVVFFLVDSRVYAWTMVRAPFIARLADLRLTSLALIAVAYALARDRVPLRPATMPRGPALRIAVLWLVGTFASVHFFGFGRIPLPRIEDRIAFLLTGSLAEELLCRGLVLGLALARWPVEANPRRALVWSSVVFALMHLQYHRFNFAAALPQLLWTLPAGYVFGLVALRSRSVAIAWIVHVVNNAIVLLA